MTSTVMWHRTWRCENKDLVGDIPKGPSIFGLICPTRRLILMLLHSICQTLANVYWWWVCNIHPTTLSCSMSIQITPQSHLNHKSNNYGYQQTNWRKITAVVGGEIGSAAAAEKQNVVAYVQICMNAKKDKYKQWLYAKKKLLPIIIKWEYSHREFSFFFLLNIHPQMGKTYVYLIILQVEYEATS